MFLRKLWLRLLVAWCKLAHRAHHCDYWFEYAKTFYVCRKCDCKFSKPRQ